MTEDTVTSERHPVLYVRGDALTPQRFWDHVVIWSDDALSMLGLARDGFVRSRNNYTIEEFIKNFPQWAEENGLV